MPETRNKQLRFIVIGGLNETAFRMDSLPGDDVYVARAASNGDEGSSGLTFRTYPQPGRDVAHVGRSGAGWYIESLSHLAAERGKSQEISGRQIPAFQPGAIQESDGLRWTLIPDDWLLMHCGTVFVAASCVHTINYASYHCGASIVGELVCYNFGPVRSDPVQLILRVVGCTDPCPVTIPALEPRESRFVESPFFHFHVMALQSQVEPMPTQLTVEVNGRAYPQATRELLVLGIWSWSYDREARETLAAFVSPHNPAIPRVVRAAEVKLNAKTGVTSFRNLLEGRRADGVRRTLQGLYDYLREDCSLSWSPPEGGCHYQRITPPHEIMDAADDFGTGQATCIDLALLFASCLEWVRLYPVVILTAGDDSVPRHALIGCWRGFSSGGAPVVETKKPILEDVKAGRLIVVEATGVAAAGPTSPNGLTFADACASAQSQIEQTPWLCAVDIMALHGEDGAITPVDCPREEAVNLAYQEAERLTRRKGRTVIQTKFLLYGCLKANGKVIRSWSRETGIDTENVCRGIDRSTPDKQTTGKLALTSIYADCQRLAELVAWRNRSPCVREQDLLWALATRGRTSSSLLRVCSELQVSLVSLEEHLRRFCHWFDMPQSFTSFASSFEAPSPDEPEG